MERNLHTVWSFSDIFLVCKMYKSDLKIMHYILKVSRFTNIVYIGKYLVLTYTERLFSTVAAFIAILLVSKLNDLSQYSTIFFLTCSKTEARFIFEGLKYSPLWKVHFQLSGTFMIFFIWSANFLRTFSATLFDSKLWDESFNYLTYFRDIQKLKQWFLFKT